MICFRSDYSQGAHPEVWKALAESNFEHTDGYGLDAHCETAAGLIKDLIGKPDCAVHFMVGGTACNLCVIAAALKPYEAVIAAETGHAYVHETGGVEATGHRVIPVKAPDGKLTPESIAQAQSTGEDEHMPLPKLVYLSQPTELGTLYRASELRAISEYCRANGLYLYLDGARLACALTAKENDLSLSDLARLCDAFYLGGTKNGALFGEALVIINEEINDHFRWIVKRSGTLLAKGRLIGVQFEALLSGGKDCLWLRIAKKENAVAQILREGLGSLGVSFYANSPTNQVFPVLPEKLVERMKEDFFFYEWAKPQNGRVALRLVTGWGSTEAEADAFVSAVQTGLEP